MDGKGHYGGGAMRNLAQEVRASGKLLEALAKRMEDWGLERDRGEIRKLVDRLHVLISDLTGEVLKHDPAPTDAKSLREEFGDIL